MDEDWTKAAKARQVIVFTHDDRLPASMRRQGIAATFLEVTRRDHSVVEVARGTRPCKDESGPHPAGRCCTLLSLSQGRVQRAWLYSWYEGRRFHSR